MADSVDIFVQLKDWAVPLGVALIVAIGAIVAAIITRGKRGNGKDVDVNELVRTLLEQRRLESPELGSRSEELKASNDNMAAEISQLKEAVGALLDRRQEPDAAPRIDDALARLADGETEAAEEILNDILTRAKADGTRALKQAAAAARHLGALRFLHDTQAAVEAYTEAVNLDPDDPDGWNMLGALRLRQGQLDPAVTAFERVLSLGNRIEDKAVIAIALGNLGMIYETRGDLDEAE